MIRRGGLMLIGLLALAPVLATPAGAEALAGTVVYVDEGAGVVHLADGRVVKLKQEQVVRQGTQATTARKAPSALPRGMRHAIEIPENRILLIRGTQAP